MPITAPAVRSRIAVHSFAVRSSRPLGLPSYRWIAREDAVRSLEDHLRESLRLLPENATTLVEEYRAFLYLLATGDGIAMPSHLLHAAMMCHIELDPDEFKSLTGMDPAQVKKAFALFDTPEQIRAAQRATLKRYRREFDRNPDLAVWSDAADQVQQRWFYAVSAACAVGLFGLLVVTMPDASRMEHGWLVLLVPLLVMLALAAVPYKSRVYVGEADEKFDIGEF